MIQETGPEWTLGGFHAIQTKDAGVVELVDAPDSKFGSARSVGSIPTTRTILLSAVN